MRIKLTQAHRHAGRDYPAGAELELREDKAQWLMGLGRAQAVPAATDNTPAAKAGKPAKE